LAAESECTASTAPQAISVVGKFTDNLDFADRDKKKAFIRSITRGRFHNQPANGVESALSCIMARTAAYTSREVIWEDIATSTEIWAANVDLNKLS